MCVVWGRGAEGVRGWCVWYGGGGLVCVVWGRGGLRGPEAEVCGMGEGGLRGPGAGGRLGGVVWGRGGRGGQRLGGVIWGRGGQLDGAGGKEADYLCNHQKVCLCL